MPPPLTLSPEGLLLLAREEAQIDGLYDDPAGYATYGVGHLVHPGDRWPSLLLAAAWADPAWRSAVARHPVGVRYLHRAAPVHRGFDALRRPAAEGARDLMARRRFQRPYAECTRAEQEAVDRAAREAVDREVLLLPQPPADVLRADLAPSERAVRETVTRHALTQPEFDALVMFAYNVGPTGFRRSGLARAVNAGAFRRGSRAEREAGIAAVEAEFLRWSRAGGRVLPGLAARRRREAAHFLAEARREAAAAPAGPAGGRPAHAPPARQRPPSWSAPREPEAPPSLVPPLP